MSELRQRQVPKPSSPDTSAPPRRSSSSDEGNWISLADIIRVIVTLVLASCGLSYYMTSSESVIWGYRPWFTRWPVVMRYWEGPLNLTPDQLALYNGTDPSLPLLLAINGTIFDVSANRMIYGPGGSYNFFTGRDATRAFVTGCFREDLTSDLTGVEEMFIPIDNEDDEAEKLLTSGQRKIRREQERRQAKAQVRGQVQHWENFFRNHKKYFEAGKVVGDPDAVDGKPVPEKRPLCAAALQNRPRRGEEGESKTGKLGKAGN
ncbi:hypothetical protein ASPZODRAFT_133615 [Penicilliopsis zonata CBS 506.65]|uniref:Cytochrome b5 heme-binding domain-containing protein n=1 Tax=Penicilliopsis zonata CBS 506.65 TaxID=1073090 RepID=A0A1L9SF82_9EURO|nr:hypothetical protein ASPZODRAFT_133615 [Penicilliopsis zonata CBS 506.65]OJJ45747.1 hypothetical protein ASPZODRAFT_133615 [Penicilliopsis zonata CBS 506.65]